MMTWITTVPIEHLGLIPDFFDVADPRPAREQLHERYAHGGGVWPSPGFRLENVEKVGGARLVYPGTIEESDEVFTELGRTRLRDEAIIVFEYALVAIVQKGGEFIVTRVD